MNPERLKNVGLTKEVWKALKGLAAERECTLSQTVAYLMEQKEKANGEEPAKPDQMGGNREN